MKKKELAEKLGFNFDEIKDILSKETLRSFEKNSVKGGNGGESEPSIGEECAIIFEITCTITNYESDCTIEPNWEGGC